MSVKRVVVDTNIVVSALTAGGTPQKIIQAWIIQTTMRYAHMVEGKISDVVNSFFIQPQSEAPVPGLHLVKE